MTGAVSSVATAVLYGVILLSWGVVLWCRLDSARGRYLSVLAVLVSGAGGFVLARGGTPGLVLTCVAPIQVLLYPFAWPSADSRLVHWGLGANVLATVGLAWLHSLR